MIKNAIATTKSFERCEKGGVAILFGLSLSVMCMMVGMAYDVGRAYSSKSKVAEAIDAAALAAAKGIRLEGLNNAQAIDLAKKVFAANMAHGAANWTDVLSVNVTIDSATSRAIVDVNSSVKTTFAAIAGITTLGGPSSATAVFDSRDIEVGVQLDMTGSMGGSKIAALKVATTELVDILLPSKPTGQKVRVGFAPFAAGVNAGSYIKAVNGNRASANNCVYERQSSTNELTDEAPTGLDGYKIKSDLASPPPGYGPIQNCPANAEIVPLTDKPEVLKASIAKFAASGSTAGQLGAAWAWNLVSPKWGTVWPAASKPVDYGDAKTDKIVILMTDGEYNTIGGVNWGNGSPEAIAASKMSVDLCTAMKNEPDANITVYTVGFKLDTVLSTNTLKDCAGRKGNPSSDGFFYVADDEEALKVAFKSIANNIMRLRLSN